MNDHIVTAVVAKANILRSDLFSLTEDAYKSLIEQGNKLYPSCFQYNKESLEVIYIGPKPELTIVGDGSNERKT